ncbi:MAG: S8 family serine peptidase [Clostridia bacterium]|nr:S8 family serine peptidase [Clostridia bacterium]
MKKFTLLLIVAILACLVMAVAMGCGDRNAPQDDNTQTQEPYEPTDEEIQAAIERYAARFGGRVEKLGTGSLIITLTMEATRKFKKYTTEDFKEVGECSLVHGYQTVMDYVEAKLKGVPTEKEYPWINPETYQQQIGLIFTSSSLEDTVRICLILERRPDIEEACPDERLTFDSEGGNSITPTDWASYINVAAAWALTEGSEDVLVGVLDSGIDHNHSNLDNNLDDTAMHRDFTVANGEFIPIPEPEDATGHGTKVAGIIAAEGTGETKGVAPNVRLVSLKVDHINNITDAVSYAKENGIHILNMSLASSLENFALHTILSNYDGLLICAAGNDGSDLDNSVLYPQIYNKTSSAEYLSNLIVVGNCDFAIGLPYPHSSSNYGDETVDLFAPGINIYSTAITGYEIVSGTSFAAPMVAGVAALLYSYIPNITASQVKAHILENVTDCSFLHGYCKKGGMLNAGAALELHAQQKSTALYNAERHYATYVNCTACGGTHTVKEPHTYGAWQYNNGTGHYHTCTECGYTETVAHTYAYVSQGSSEHSRTCSICGYSDNESHQLIYINLGIYQGHRSRCAKCSYTLYTEAHTWYYNNHTHINHCMKCNATAQVVPIIQNIEEPE